MSRLVTLAAALSAAVLAAGCEDTCETDADCPAGTTCDAGLCLDDIVENGGSGGAGGTPCADADGDAACDAADNCPADANADQEDVDLDLVGDACDPCPADPQNDADGDGVCADADLCPTVADPDQADLDADREGDACDLDDDGDGSPDAADCRPRDATVYPGADDPCDWVDTDCVPDACRFPVTALGEGQRIVELSCLKDTRRCAVVTTTEAGAGSLLWLELGSPISLLLAVPVPAPRGVDVKPFRGEPIAWVTDATSVRAVKLADVGPTLITLAAGGTLPGPVAASRDANLGVAPLEGSRLLLFDPLSLLTSGLSSVTCGGAELQCKHVDLSGLEGASGPLGVRLPHRLALKEPVGGAGAAYLAFADDRRLAILPIGSGLQPRFDLAGLLDPELAAPAELFFDEAAARLYLLGVDGSGARVLGGLSADDHVSLPFAAPDGTCPTALGVFEGRLEIGQGCAGAAPGLLSFDLDAAGLPIAGEPRADPLPGCTPRRIVPVPGSEGSTPPVLAIACEDADALLVFGRD